MNRGMCESVVVSWFEGRPDEILLYINTVIILLIPLLIVPSCVLCVVRWFIMYTCVCVCVCCWRLEMASSQSGCQGREGRA